MMTPSTVIVSGRIFLDDFGERAFVATGDEAHVVVGNHTIAGSHVFRVLPSNNEFSVFPDAVFVGKKPRVSILAHVASSEELQSHDQLTSPTLVADRVALAESIEQRAFQIYETTGNALALDNWLTAERELLAVDGLCS